MSSVTPRLRLFAGPNGSGKSTLNSLLSPRLKGIYLNPDALEARLKAEGQLQTREYGVSAPAEEMLTFFRKSHFLQTRDSEATRAGVTAEDSCLRVPIVSVNSYLASVMADFLRQKLLAARESFTLETVMSHPSKIDLLRQARSLGYRTYLYFVATKDPSINISRVAHRVRNGGHDVPEEKIRTRYHASLALLKAAVEQTNRAYIFDNSEDEVGFTWIAEITDGSRIVSKTDHLPNWFAQALL